MPCTSLYNHYLDAELSRNLTLLTISVGVNDLVKDGCVNKIYASFINLINSRISIINEMSYDCSYPPPFDSSVFYFTIPPDCTIEMEATPIIDSERLMTVTYTHMWSSLFVDISIFNRNLGPTLRSCFLPLKISPGYVEHIDYSHVINIFHNLLLNRQPLSGCAKGILYLANYFTQYKNPTSKYYSEKKGGKR